MKNSKGFEIDDNPPTPGKYHVWCTADDDGHLDEWTMDKLWDGQRWEGGIWPDGWREIRAANDMSKT